MLNIIEWNIHQQGRKSDIIPMFILDYIQKDTDVVVLLEFNSQSSNFHEFRKELNAKGYRVFVTDYQECAYANDILIAVKSTGNILVKSINYYMAYNNNSPNYDESVIPENLFLEVLISNKRYIIAAIRIKELDKNYKKRKQEMKSLVEWTEKIDSPIILVGDFNNLREGTKIKEWNIQVLDSLIVDKFIRKTPSNNYSWGCSYYPYESKYDGYIKEDHLLYSTSLAKIGIDCADYSWDFLENKSDQYKMKAVNSYGQQEIEFPTGFPDHAILHIQINLPSST